jgi:hypothetical protein
VDLDRDGAPDGAAQRGGGDRCEHARGTVAPVELPAPSIFFWPSIAESG